MKFLALVAGLLVMVAVAVGVVDKQLRLGRGQKVGPTPTAAAAVELGKVKLSAQMEEGKLKLLAEPVGGEVQLSAFALKLKVVAGKLGDGGKLMPSGEMVEAGWSFPIAKAEEIQGGVEIKLAGAFLSTQKYDFGGRVELARVSIKGGGIEFEVDREETRFLVKDGRRVEVEGL